MIRLSSVYRDLSRALKYVKRVSFSSKRRIGVFSAVVLIGLTGVIGLFAIRGGNQELSMACQQLVDSNKDQKFLYRKQDYENILHNLESNKSCEPKKSFLGIGTDDRVENKLNQIQFYHSKSTIEYQLGKFEEARKNAEAGLSINSGLKDGDKTLDKHEAIIQDLVWVRDGEY